MEHIPWTPPDLPSHPSPNRSAVFFHAFNGNSPITESFELIAQQDCVEALEAQVRDLKAKLA